MKLTDIEAANWWLPEALVLAPRLPGAILELS